MKINRTVKRTIEILELIATSEVDLSLNEISKALEIPKTSAFDILETLVQLNMLYIKNQGNKTYAVGVKAYSIGMNYSRTSLLLNTSTPIIKELARKTGLTVFIAKEDNKKILYTSKHDPIKKIIATPEVGHRGFLHSTGAGKSILAFSSNQEKLMDTITLHPLTNNTIISMNALKEELDMIKTQGYAFVNGEDEEHAFSIGAPIFDHNGIASAAIEILGLYKESYNPTDDIKLLKKAATEISKLQGWNP